MRKGSNTYSNSQFLQQVTVPFSSTTNSTFSILKSIQNCKLTVPSSQTDYKYYQIDMDNGSALRIYFMTHSIIRIRMNFGRVNKGKKQQNYQEDIFKQQSYSLTMTAWEDRFDQLMRNHRRRIKPLTNVNFQLRQSIEGKYYYFQTNQLIGKIFTNPYGMKIYNKNGFLLYKDLKGRAYKRDLQGRIYHYNQIDQKNDCFYGFGENTGKINKAGCRVRLAPQDSLGYDAETTSPLYKHIPFYIKLNKKNKHAIGLFYNNSYEATFDMGSQRSGYWPRYSYYQADGGDIDLFIINGPSMKRVIQRYTDLTGKTNMSPMHSLGYIGSTMYYAELEENCDKVIMQFVQKCMKENVPISNFHLSSGYTLSQNKNIPKRYVFNWNNKKFPCPQTFFNSMQGLGVHVTPNIKPGMLTTHHLYDQFSKNIAFIKSPQNINLPYVDRWWGGEGSFVDFTDKNSRQLWKKYLQEQIISKGTTCIWNDNNQYQSIDNRGAVCTFDHQKSPIQRIKSYKTVDQLKTVQSLLMAHIAQQAVKQLNPNVRPYIVTRSGCAGIQRYASSWSGDNFTTWKTLQSNISTMLNMGLSGFANYGCDIGGFWGPGPSAELFVRWVQHGIFQPRFSIHSCNSDNTVTQPWIFPQYSKLIAKTIRFRYLLLPYLYSLLYFSHIKGRPIIRPLAYQFQDSDFEACSQQDKIFMLGPYMLIANVIQPISQLQSQCKGFPKMNRNEADFISFPSVNNNITNCVQLSQYIRYANMISNTSITSRNVSNIHKSSQLAYKAVYLPKGCNWYTWNGRERYPGGTTVLMKISMQSIPIFIKDRSIIPLAIKYGKKAKEASISMLDMNKQKIIGLYLKICYDNDTYNSDNFRNKFKNNLEFMLYQDDGKSVLSKNQKQKQFQESMLQSGIFTTGTSQKLPQISRFNLQIPSSATYLITKISAHNQQIRSQTSIQPQLLQQKSFNQNMLIIDINRIGNLQSTEINSVEKMILQIKSIDVCPVWISINNKKCKQVLYEDQWKKWNPISPSIQKLKSENLLNQRQVEIEDYGCWYYDQEKGAAILKINKYLVKPFQNIIQKYRSLTIKVCKDKMIQFSNQYKNQEQSQNSQQKSKSRKMSVDRVDIQQIEERIVGQQGRKIKQRRRIIIKDKEKDK